jgi:heme ABC exporter ATP-binding subunit CcmA
VTAPEVELAACSKRFGERIALRRVTLRVDPAETVAVMGANGSGKSTLLRLCAGLARPTAGEARLAGVAAAAAPPALRARIGYAGHRAHVYRGLSARENLVLFARLQRAADGAVAAALERVGLAARADDRVDGYSRGMLQRLALARALLHDPDVILLDEPATGLDAEGATLLEAALAERRGRATVLVATHDEGFAARVADRVVRLERGELVA